MSAFLAGNFFNHFRLNFPHKLLIFFGQLGHIFTFPNIPKRFLIFLYKYADFEKFKSDVFKRNSLQLHAPTAI